MERYGARIALMLVVTVIVGALLWLILPLSPTT